MPDTTITITNAILLVIIVIMVYSITFAKRENYAPCPGCSNKPIGLNGVVQMNPFSWPYSAFANPDSVFLPPGAAAVAKRSAPLTSLSTPDHDLLTN